MAVSAVQCWTSLEEYFGVVPCTIMSMMSNELMSSACEVDICGVLAMHALRLASGTPSALLDWNNNYGEDPNKAVCFHCSNLPKHFFAEVRMDFQADYRRYRRQREHFRHMRRTRESRPDELRALFDGRLYREDSRICRRWRIHHGPARNLRRRGSGGNSAGCRIFCGIFANAALNTMWPQIWLR